MIAFLGSLAVVVLAEMGDKTQLLAMAMALRFPVPAVLWGVALATLLNHGLAVAFGTYAGWALDLQLIQVVAAVSFIGFGLWTIRGDQLAGEEKRTSSWGPVATVAIAFFLAEMGDKTQLATIALAANYQAPTATLLGTTGGMLVADAIGIYAGIVAGRRVPERQLKWFAALIFAGFGLYGLFRSLPAHYLSPLTMAAILGFTALAFWLVQRHSSRS